jgi:hypothetical protein
MHKAVSRHGAASRLARAQTRGFKGAMDAFKSTLETTQITIGTVLLPTLTRYLRIASRWLGNARNQRRIQHDVNQVLKTSGQVIRGVVTVLRPLVRGTIGLTHALGGAKRTAELFAGVWVGMKILRWAGQLRTLAAALRGVAVAEALAGGGGAGLAGPLRKVLGSRAVRIGGPLAIAAAIIHETFGFEDNTAADVKGSKGSPYPRGTELNDLWQLGRRGLPYPDGYPHTGREFEAWSKGRRAGGH